MDLSIIKFGGSVITDPSAPERFNASNTRRLGDELSASPGAFIVVHGTGHVGKPVAREHDFVREGRIPHEKRSLAVEIRSDLQRLNLNVTKALIASSVDALALDPVAFFGASMDEMRYGEQADDLRGMLHSGLVPCFHGDLMPQADGAFRVFSSDAIVL